MKEKNVRHEQNICNVMESISGLRCYKCCGYMHKASTCKNKKARLRCCGEHEIKECQAIRNEYINCKVFAEKRKLSCTVL